MGNPARVFFIFAMSAHAFVYITYMALDIAGLFLVSYVKRQFKMAFYANIFWTGFNWVGFIIVVTLAWHAYKYNDFLRDGRVREDVPLLQQNRVNRGDVQQSAFIIRHLGPFIIAMMFIDAIGLAIDIAIWADGKESSQSTNILFWKAYEVISDFVIVFGLDPFLFIIYIRRIFKSENENV